MNDNAIELYKQALTFAYTEAGKNVPSHIIQSLSAAKLAELIIKECAYLCVKDYHTPDGYGITDADERCANLIRKHFGVEE